MKPEELPNPDDVLKRMLNTPPQPKKAKKQNKKKAQVTESGCAPESLQ